MANIGALGRQQTVNELSSTPLDTCRRVHHSRSRVNGAAPLNYLSIK